MRHTMFEKGQSKRIWGELYKVIDSSDVVVQVVPHPFAEILFNPSHMSMLADSDVTCMSEFPLNNIIFSLKVTKIVLYQLWWVFLVQICMLSCSVNVNIVLNFNQVCHSSIWDKI